MEVLRRTAVSGNPMDDRVLNKLTEMKQTIYHIRHERTDRHASRPDVFLFFAYAHFLKTILWLTRIWHICFCRFFIFLAERQKQKSQIFPRSVWVLCILTTLFSIDSFGQIQTPQTPIFPQTPQPWTPNNNNIPTTPNHNRPSGTNQYEKDRQQQLDKQKQLDEIYKEIKEPSNADYSNVKYNLPSCATVKGAAAYHSAFLKISGMASGQTKFNIKEANFTVENAFYENTGNIQEFDKLVKQIGQFLNWKMDELGYNKNSNLAKNLILFRFFTDTLEIKSKNLKHLPINYDFDDYMGHEDWTKMFVEKLLETNAGQCHSLPLLYLILAEEIGAKAQLSYSPNHTYIKFQDDNGKWHNIELTNGMLTTDAFVLQSGYIKAEALQNKIYMQPLTQKQLISHSLFDLAKGYAIKYCYDEFVEQVINKALELDPNNINAHMVKSDFHTIHFRYIENQLGINEQNYKQKLNQYPKAKEIFLTRNKQYDKVDNLGYENMPAAAYEKWLNSLSDAKQQQQSKEMLHDLNKSIQIKNPEIRR